jgi:hypothetical protein
VLSKLTAFVGVSEYDNKTIASTKKEINPVCPSDFLNWDD